MEEEDFGEDDADDEGEMYNVQGNLREWVSRDEVRRFIARRFRNFLNTFRSPKDESSIEYVNRIRDLVESECTLPGARPAHVAAALRCSSHCITRVHERSLAAVCLGPRCTSGTDSRVQGNGWCSVALQVRQCVPNSPASGL